VAPRVGIARLDRARQSAHGQHVGAAQLLCARALFLEGIAQIGCIALELAFLLSGFALALLKLGFEPSILARSSSSVLTATI